MVNADLAQAMTKLVPDRLRRNWTDRKIENRKFSCSTFMMYLGLEGRFPNLDHHTIYLADDYRRNLRDIETGHVLSQNPSLYVHNPCATDPAMAPPGMSSLYVLVPVTHQHPNVDWQNDYSIYRGATFNLAHNLRQMLHLRPHNRFEDLESVYLVGGGTHPGSGLRVIYESAKITSRLLAQDLGVRPAWSEFDPAEDEQLLDTGTRRVARIAHLLGAAPAGPLAISRPAGVCTGLADVRLGSAGVRAGSVATATPLRLHCFDPMTAAAAAAFGLMLASACRSRAQLNGISSVLILVMSAPGGSMFPRFLMPEQSQRVGLLTFNAWALDGYQKIFSYEAGIGDLLPQLAVLGFATLVFLLVARQLARRQLPI